MPSVQMRLWCMCDEELTAVGVRTGVGHRNDAGIVAERITLELILERIARSPASGALRVSPLDHKRVDHPAGGPPVTKTLAGEKDEVVHRARRLLRIELEAYAAPGAREGGVEGGRGGTAP